MSLEGLRSDAPLPSPAREALNRCRGFKPGSRQAIAACEEAVSLHAVYADARYFLGVNYIYADEGRHLMPMAERLFLATRCRPGNRMPADLVLSFALVSERPAASQ